MNHQLQAIRKKHIGGWLRDNRKDRGLTMREISKSLNLETPQYIFNVETGRAPICLMYVKPLCAIYNIPTDVFINRLTNQYKEVLKVEISS